MRSGAVEGVHQQLQGLTELPSSATEAKKKKRRGELKLEKLSNQSAKLTATRVHLEAHCEFVFSGGSFPRANTSVGHRGQISLLLKQLSHQLRLTHRHAEAPVSNPLMLKQTLEKNNYI